MTGTGTSTPRPTTHPPVPRRTQEERKADTRARLLAAAAALFAEHGVEAVSVDAVAEAAGRTSGAVYSHFGAKHGLLLALLDEWRHSLVEVVSAELEQATTLQDRLRAVAANVVVDPSEDTRRLMALERELWRLARHDEPIAHALRARSADAQAHMARGFAAWKAQGIVEESADPATLATALRALVIGLEMHQRVDPVLDVDEASAALALVVSGATRRGSRHTKSNDTRT